MGDGLMTATGPGWARQDGEAVLMNTPDTLSRMSESRVLRACWGRVEWSLSSCGVGDASVVETGHSRSVGVAHGCKQQRTTGIMLGSCSASIPPHFPIRSLQPRSTPPPLKKNKQIK